MKKSTPAVIITGASSGIGKATAKEFARIGFRVFTLARRLNELERINKELESENLVTYPYACNVASASNIDQVLKKILSESNINCIINNAGITAFKKVEKTSVKEINDIISTNMLGSIYLIKHILPHFISNGEGAIINVLSTAAKTIFTESSAYSASKAGMLAFANVLREEVRDYNIRVTNILPGATETPMWSVEDRKQHSQRMMSPEEIAQVLVWVTLQKGNLTTEEMVLRPVQGDIN